MKNYTSAVDSSKTIARIEAILAKTGAQNIIKNYQDGLLVNVTFTLKVNGKVIAILLPANIDAAFEVMRAKVKRPHQGTLDRLREQAARTAWKLQQEWLEIQLSFIEMKQVEPLQAFMGYIYNGKTTLYQVMKSSGFKLLTEGTK